MFCASFGLCAQLQSTGIGQFVSQTESYLLFSAWIDRDKRSINNVLQFTASYFAGLFDFHFLCFSWSPAHDLIDVLNFLYIELLACVLSSFSRRVYFTGPSTGHYRPLFSLTDDSDRLAVG